MLLIERKIYTTTVLPIAAVKLNEKSVASNRFRFLYIEFFPPEIEWGGDLGIVQRPVTHCRTKLQARIRKESIGKEFAIEKLYCSIGTIADFNRVLYL